MSRCYVLFLFYKILNMKRLKNYEKTICGIEYLLFAIIKNQKTSKYCYYISAPWSTNVCDRMIYKSKSKSIVLNKYTLSFLGSLYTLLVCTVAYPIMAVYIPIYMYFDGARNFIRDRAWAQNERYFNWCNMFIIAGLIVWLVLK